MRGLMMDFPLTLPTLLERAGKIFGRVEIVWRQPDRSVTRYTWNDLYRRSRKLANVLTDTGLKRGDRVATLMWNHGAHLEAYYGVPIAGGVLHPLNLRLHLDEITYIANHAADRFLIVDDVLLPIYEKLRDRVNFERVIVVPYGGGINIPGNFDNYEDLLSRASEDFQYPDFDENEAAAMCYTSGTTGRPKGVLYSHRSIVLHSFSCCLADGLGISQQDTILPVAPLFHSNGWGIAYNGAMAGSKIVLAGLHLDAESILDLMMQERVTLTQGVPTVWLGVLNELQKQPERWKFTWPIRLMLGGGATSEALMRGMAKFGITVVSVWGMTEMSPHGSTSVLRPYMNEWSETQKYALLLKQGVPSPFVEARVTKDDGTQAPHDGETVGEIEVRGPWVASAYYDAPEQAGRWSPDGWLKTGDVGHIDQDGYIKLVDRSKDLIKSGGEWISSVDLENALLAHPSVKEAAVIGVTHPTWQERPIAIIVLHNGDGVKAEDLRSFLSTNFAKWQLPDEFLFVKEIPRTSVGKFNKVALREEYARWEWGTKK